MAEHADPREMIRACRARGAVPISWVLTEDALGALLARPESNYRPDQARLCRTIQGLPFTIGEPGGGREIELIVAA